MDKLKEKIAIPANIKNAVRDLHWMARRYADGRCSYAPGMFNGRVRDLLAAGLQLGQPLFARDGMGRAFDGLTEEEVAAAEEDMPRMHTKVFEIAEDRMNAVWDQAVEACVSECFHDEQLQVWSDEFLGELSMIGHINPDTSYDDVVDMHRRFQEFLKHTVVSRICSVKRSQSQTGTDGAEAMKHLGNVMSFFADLDEDDRCRAFTDALEFFNSHHPDSQIQGEPGFTQRICIKSPLGSGCRNQIEEAHRADTESAASADTEEDK
jgi:hypothetical protein